jgi:hypothetical protein
MRARTSRAPKSPTAANGTDTAAPITIAWTAVRAASSGSFSPILRATSAVVAIERPRATE